MGPSAETAQLFAHGHSIPAVCIGPESGSAVPSFLHLPIGQFPPRYCLPSSPPLPASMVSHHSSPSLVSVPCVLSAL